MLRHVAAFALSLLCASLLAAESPALSLANVYRGNLDLDRYWASEKLDGVRAYWDGAALHSRNGNRFNAPAWFVEGFPQIALDGELWMGRGTFEVLSGAVRRQTPDDVAWRRIRFMVFDLPGSSAPFDERLKALRRLLRDAPPRRIRLVEQFRVASEADLMATLERIVAAGGEGLMLRDGRSLYRAGRSDDLLKLKTFDDAEAVVVDHVPGKGQVHRHDGLAARRDARRSPFQTRHRVLGRRATHPAARRGDGHLPAFRHHGQRHPPVRQLHAGSA